MKPNKFDKRYNTEYEKLLLTENKIKLLEPYKTAKSHHKMQCLICNHEWSATPISKRQTLKKYGVGGCPNCNNIKKEKEYIKTRTHNLQRLKDRGIEVLTKDYDGRIYLDYDKNPHLKIKVRNVNCGHVFECSPSNLLGAETECSICGPQKRVQPLIQWSKANSKKWQETATEWEMYRNNVHNFTRQTYKKHHKKINPKKFPRGKAGVEGAYHLDHQVSVRFCFDNNVPPEICAHHTNLQMLKWKDNISSKASLKGALPPLFLPYV